MESFNGIPMESGQYQAMCHLDPTTCSRDIDFYIYRFGVEFCIVCTFPLSPGNEVVTYWEVACLPVF